MRRSRAARLLETLRGALPSFEIIFTKVAYGPEPRRPRLIWAEGTAPPALLALKERTDATFGHATESRPLRTHLTLARFRAEGFSRFPLKRLKEKVEWIEPVRRIMLMASPLGPSRADYEIFQEVPL